jgi:hypothetical protein
VYETVEDAGGVLDCRREEGSARDRSKDGGRRTELPASVPNVLLNGDGEFEAVLLARDGEKTIGRSSAHLSEGERVSGGRRGRKGRIAHGVEVVHRSFLVGDGGGGGRSAR